MTAESALREEICRFAKSIYDRGLTHGSTGNISVRLDDGWLMTPTGSSMGFLDPAALSRLDAEGRHLSGDKPTKEHFLHMAVYGARTAGAVVHLHSTHSVALSCLPETDPENALPPVTAYAHMQCGRVAVAPYHPPGDLALADAVGGLAGKHSAILLANHGPVVAGKSLAAAVYATEELEATARLALLLRGLNPRLLTPAQLEELDARFPRT